MRNDTQYLTFFSIAKFARGGQFALALFVLLSGLVLPLTARAQTGWVPVQCNASGSTFYYFYQDDQGFTAMPDGAESGTATSTFPPAITTAYVDDPSEYGYLRSPYEPDPTLCSFLFPPTQQQINVSVINIPYNPGYTYATNSIGTYSIYPTANDPGLPTASGPANGSITVHEDGELRAYFKMVYETGGHQVTPPAGSPMPDHVSLLIKSQVQANAWFENANTPATPTGGFTAHARASDSFGETVSVPTAFPTVNGTQPPPQTAGGVHIVSAKVAANGVAEVYLKGSIDSYSDDEVDFAHYGSSSSYGYAQVTGLVRPLPVNLAGYSTHCAPALGGSDSNWTPAAPRYFSGTGCEVDGTAVPASGYLTHAQLCVGDTVVKEYYDKSLAPFTLPDDGSMDVGTALPSETLKALFDSTHFTSGAMIPLTLKVWDSNNGYYESRIQAPAKNRLYAVANREFPNRWPYNSSSNAYSQIADVSSQASGMNYFAVSTHDDDKPAMFNTFPSYTAFFAVTHASIETGFLDCVVDPDWQGELGLHFITDVPNSSYYLANGKPDNESLQDMRAVKAANPNLPPYNFVQLNCCEIGQDDRYAVGFGISPTAGDRACLAWKDTIVLDAGEANWTEGLWAGLSAGETLHDAAILQIVGANPTSTVWAQIGDWPFPPFKFAFPYVYGDGRMTLHGVYSGTNVLTFGNSHASQWYRPLS